MTDDAEPVETGLAGRRGALLYLVFFLSGAAALVFEAAWFRQTGLMLGNSVWSSSMVLASFMAGLAIGTGLVGAYGHRLRSPLRLYVVLELVIAVVGVTLTLLLPRLNELLAPWLGQLLDRPLLLNVVRLVLSFVLLALPAIAMGATLPLLVRELCGQGRVFVRSLGILYGLNTLGAVLGVITAEWVLFGAVGVVGTALCAGLADVTAALAIWWLARRVAPPAPEAEAPPEAPEGRVWPLLLCAGLSGMCLLALEVVWFRLLILTTFGTTRAFAAMLAVVLCGIALGGLTVSRFPTAPPHSIRAGATALGAGGLLVGSYLLSLGATAQLPLWLSALVLMGPVCFASGCLYTLLGQTLQQRWGGSSRPAGHLTLANTAGGMLGALLGAFVLLPGLGAERSIFALALVYGVIALLVTPAPARLDRRQRIGLAAAAVGFGAGVVAFPHGDLLARLRTSSDPDVETMAVREGVSETTIYRRRVRFGEPLSYRLITNQASMSTTSIRNRRYMDLFAHLPLALHPNPKSALLISFGVGNTARALVTDPGLETIHVVDISRDVLELNDLVYPPGQRPLEDPRVTAIVEDGRFYMQVARTNYDIITGEPPPPKGAGIGALYSREFFQLAHDRLRPGGMLTYWLPLYLLGPGDSRAIVSAFTEVFPDSSLWLAAGADWILLGVKPGGTPTTATGFRAHWRGPHRPGLRAIGFERPEHLGSMFVADAEQLVTLWGKSPPLVDDFPHRLSPRQDMPFEPDYARLVAAEPARTRFGSSAHIARWWPAALRSASLPHFEQREVYDRVTSPSPRPTGEHPLATVDRLLRTTDLETLPLWLLGSDADEQAIVARVAPAQPRSAQVWIKRGDGALARRRYGEAASHYLTGLRLDPGYRFALPRYIYSLIRSGKRKQGRSLAGHLLGRLRTGQRDPLLERFLERLVRE